MRRAVRRTAVIYTETYWQFTRIFSAPARVVRSMKFRLPSNKRALSLRIRVLHLGSQKSILNADA